VEDERESDPEDRRETSGETVQHDGFQLRAAYTRSLNRLGAMIARARCLVARLRRRYQEICADRCVVVTVKDQVCAWIGLSVCGRDGRRVELRLRGRSDPFMVGMARILSQYFDKILPIGRDAFDQERCSQQGMEENQAGQDGSQVSHVSGRLAALPATGGDALLLSDALPADPAADRTGKAYSARPQESRSK